jgi:adenosyl cobinamide kinase/adenosyl cobinamide phosphate guanylyltransferase
MNLVLELQPNDANSQWILINCLTIIVNSVLATVEIS